MSLRIGPRARRVVVAVAIATVATTACAGSAAVDEQAEPADRTQVPPPSVEIEGEAGSDDEPAPPPAAIDPVPFVPGGPVGSEQDYNALVDALAADIPAELRGQVPWPNLRAPDPATAQLEIFELWIWMAANHPDPALVALMAAPDSPSRQEIGTHFRLLDADNELRVRADDPYKAWDHRTVTFESAGLPLWLGRDVPEDAVVVYYMDSSGPTTTLDRSTRDLLRIDPGVPPRQWLSIMVPTDVGWQLWRDQLIEPGDAELRVPDALPSPDASTRQPDV